MTELEQYCRERSMTVPEAVRQLIYNHLRQYPDTKFTIKMLAQGVGLAGKLIEPEFNTLGLKRNLVKLERTSDNLEFTIQYLDPWAGGLKPSCLQEGEDPYDGEE